MPKHVGTNRLTALECKEATGPAILEDGAGLRLVVMKSGARRWVLRASIRGKRHDFGLGSFSAIGLKDARDRAIDLRRRIEAGEAIEPARRDAKQRKPARMVLAHKPEPGAITLRDAFRDFWRIKKPQLQNPKHAAQWVSTLETYALPLLGARPVADITTREVATMLEPIWREIPETAQRVQQRLKMIFDFAIASDYRTAGNPTLPVKMILGERGQQTNHHRAMPYADVPAFIAALRLRRGDGASRLALEWLVLTATRSAETRLALVSEVDVDAAVWRIRAERTKMRRQHDVPLPLRCIEIFRECRKLWPKSPLLFPSEQGRKPHLSENTFQRTLELMDLGERATAHGMRSSFRDWAAEVAKARHEVAEACLGHMIKDKVVKAYLRASFVEERRQLLAAWADYCGSAVSQPGTSPEAPIDQNVLSNAEPVRLR
jgi:integrase